MWEREVWKYRIEMQFKIISFASTSLTECNLRHFLSDEEFYKTVKEGKFTSIFCENWRLPAQKADAIITNLKIGKY